LARLGPCAPPTTEAAEAWARALEQQVASQLEAAAALPPPLLPELPPRFQVHGDAASARARSGSSRSANGRSSGTSGGSGGGGDMGAEAVSAARAMAAEAVALRRGVAAARAEQLGGSHAETVAAAVALASAIESEAACLDFLDQRAGSRLGEAAAAATGVAGGRPGDAAAPPAALGRSPHFGKEGELLTHREAAHACRAEASQLRAAVALALAAAAARAPPPTSAYVPAYVTGQTPAYITGQPKGKGSPPVPEAGSEIPDFSGGKLGIFS
jgi:hypothetical protein